MTGLFSLMRRIAQERDGVTVEGRDLIGEAMQDRPYNPNPWQTQQLAEAKPGTGVPIAGAKIPQNLLIEQVDGKWWGNKPAFGPFDTVRELEIAVYGRSELSAGKRDFRDEAPKPGE
jgi:hypothetical protein